MSVENLIEFCQNKKPIKTNTLFKLVPGDYTSRNILQIRMIKSFGMRQKIFLSITGLKIDNYISGIPTDHNFSVAEMEIQSKKIHTNFYKIGINKT